MLPTKRTNLNLPGEAYFIKISGNFQAILFTRQVIKTVWIEVVGLTQWTSTIAEGERRELCMHMLTSSWRTRARAGRKTRGTYFNVGASIFFLLQYICMFASIKKTATTSLYHGENDSCIDHITYLPICCSMTEEWCDSVSWQRSRHGRWHYPIIW